MITVRFPSGLSITYNDANFLSRGVGDQGWYLYQKQDGKADRMIAFIQQSAGAIVEFVNPCRIERQADKLTLDSALQLLADHVEDIRPNYYSENRKHLNTIKQKLSRYNRKSNTWSKPE